MSRTRLVASAVRARARQGARRVQDSGVPILEASVAAALAWGFSHFVLGRPNPFFAPVAAWTCLGFTRDRDVRAVAELAIGVSIGIALGDFVVHWIGTGAWQIALILMLAASIARFVSTARLVVAQAGVQAIIVVALPTGSGPLGRWTDALIGGAIALAFSALIPRDPRNRPRQAARRAFGEISQILAELADALKSKDRGRAQEALTRGRTSQDVIDAWSHTLATTAGLLKVSPLAKRYAGEFALMQRAEKYGDRSLRSARVVCRRATAMLEMPERRDVRWERIARVVAMVADGTAMLGDAYGTGGSPAKALPRLRQAAEAMTSDLGEGGWDAHAFVLLLRSLAIDLMRAAGLSQAEARAVLPRL